MVLMNLFVGQQQRRRHGEQTESGGRRWWEELREECGNIHMATCKTDKKWKSAVSHDKLSPGPVTTQRGDGEGDGREGTYVYLWLIHVEGWQKPTQSYELLSSSKNQSINNSQSRPQRQ